MGGFILLKLTHRLDTQAVRTHLIPLGLIGGLLDALGGGGWGPIVNSTLIVRGNAPARTIGTASLAEFFVALSASLAFVLTLGEIQWTVVVALIAGGVLAAPLSAWVSGRLPVRSLLLLVGVMVIVVSLTTIAQAFR
jgi:hypothetical protein